MDFKGLKYKIEAITPFIDIIVKDGRTLEEFRNELLDKYKSLIKVSEESKTTLRIDLDDLNFETVLFNYNSRYHDNYIEIHNYYRYTSDENDEYFKKYDNILTIKGKNRDSYNSEETLFIISDKAELDSLTTKYSNNSINFDAINDFLNKFMDKNTDLLLNLFNLIKDNDKVNFNIKYYNKKKTKVSRDFNDITLEFIRHDPKLEQNGSIIGVASFGTFYITDGNNATEKNNVEECNDNEPVDVLDTDSINS